jgi:hypothetical protein
MSKRHTASRRRNYGRRQHELHERMDRRSERRVERTWRTNDVDLDPFGYVQSGDQPFGFID